MPEDFDPFEPMTELAERIRTGELSPTDAVEGYLAAIESRDDGINAYVTVTETLARETAAEREREDPTGPLHGVPVALKDLRDMKEGVPHSFGFAPAGRLGYTAERTTVPVERLEDAGAIILGKTNTPAFGHKGVTQNEYVGATASPIDPEANAGGSSGGAAAAVAGGMAAVATGSDAGGSIRIPAAACNVFGHKPSFGLVPVDGRPDAFGRRLQHSVHGPLARTVRDAAAVLDVTAGYHPRDPTSVPVDIDFLGAVERPVDGLRVGYSPDLEVFPVSPAVVDTVEEALDALEAAGATVEPVTVDHGLSMERLADDIETTMSATLAGAVEVVRQDLTGDLEGYRRLAADAGWEVATDLLGLVRDRQGLVSETLLDLLETGTRQTAQDVAATGLARTRVFDAVQDVLAEYDLLATPTTAVSKLPLHTDQGLEWKAALTWPFNWTGHPAAAVPAGETDDGGLASLQLVGRQYEDDTVLAASAALERERPWDHRY
jgi:aspartyl-tRNA(Asn)/glutamyl-tRNA(Gln) amidotransferase subunit A